MTTINNEFGRTIRRSACVLGAAALLTFGAAGGSQVSAQIAGRPQARQGVRQPRMDPAQRTERRVQMLTRRLQLSADQAARIRAILVEQQRQWDADRPRQGWRTSGQRPDSAQMRQLRERMRAQREQTRQRIEAVLNPQQRATFQQLEARKQDRTRGRRGANRY